VSNQFGASVKALALFFVQKKERTQNAAPHKPEKVTLQMAKPL